VHRKIAAALHGTRKSAPRHRGPGLEAYEKVGPKRRNRADESLGREKFAGEEEGPIRLTTPAFLGALSKKVKKKREGPKKVGGKRAKNAP